MADVFSHTSNISGLKAIIPWLIDIVFPGFERECGLTAF